MADASFAKCNSCHKGLGDLPATETGEPPLFRCAACKLVHYCSRDHQKSDWKTHKGTCKKLKELAASGKPWIKKVIKEGDADSQPPIGNEVFVHYTGYLPTGEVFDSSRKRGEEYAFMLGMGSVIQGWDEGVRTMNRGERAELIIGAEHAYGSMGQGSIPPNTPLIFDIEVISFRKAEIIKTGTNFL